MSFSFCMNKCDLLAVCALTLLYQAIDLKRDSKLLREDERLVNDVLKTLRKNQSPGFVDLERAASVLITVTDPSGPMPVKHARKPSVASSSRRASPPTSFAKQNSPPLGFQTSASDTDLTRHQDKSHWTGSMSSLQGPNADVQQQQQPPSRQSFDGHRQERQSSTSSRMSRLSPNAQARQNLDYLSLNDTPFTAKHAASPPTSMQAQQPMGMQNNGQQTFMHNGQPVTKNPNMNGSDWEALVGSMDSGMNNVYDVIYGGASIEAAMTGHSTSSEWSPDSWDLSNFNIGEFGNNPAPPQSVLSMSDESLSSGEEVSPSELGLSLGNMDYGKQLQGVNYHHNGDGYSTNGLHGMSL